MRQFRLIVIALITSLAVINAVFLRKAIAVLLCGVLSFNSTSCYSFLSENGKADAAQADISEFASSVKQLDEDHAEIRLTFLKSCEFISHLTKTPEGIIQDSLEYSHNNIEVCGVKPFTAHYSNVGKTIEIQLQGEKDRLRLDASANTGDIEQTYQDASGKVHKQTIPIPKKILDYLNESQKNSLVEGGSSALPNSKGLQSEQLIRKPWLVTSNKTEKLYAPDTVALFWQDSDLGTACGRAKFGQHTCNWMSMISGGNGLGSLKGVSIRFGPYLTLATLAAGMVCWGLYGGFPPIFGFKAFGLERKLENGNQALTRNLDAWGKLKDTPIFQAYGNDLKRINQELARTESGNAVIGIGVAMDSYFSETSKPGQPSGILSDLIKGKLYDFLKKCDEDEKKKQLVQARSSNDPHLVTFDGLKYDLQTVGEVILIKSNHSDFEVQARQTPWNGSASVSINSAVAIKVGSDRIALYAQGLPDTDTSTPLRVNGEPTTIQGEKLSLPSGGEILKQGGSYVISAPTGEKVLVKSAGSFFNISPIVHNHAGKYSGLLGNVNGNPKDDLQMRGGKNALEVRSTYGDVKQVLNLTGLRLPGVLDRAEQVYFDQLYKEFANSWRVKQEESLFDYPPGKTTESYLNPGFPDKYLTLNMLSADQIQKAQNACTEAKVTEDLMEGCIFDVGFSGFSEFARTTAEISGYVGIVNQLIPGLNIPTPEQAVERVIQKVKPKVCLPIIGCV